MLKAQIIGYIGKDAYISSTENGSVANFNVAHSEKWKGTDGIQKERTTWVSCSLWDKDNLHPYLKKGTQVYVEGFPGVQQYEDASHKARAQLTFRVNSIQLLGSRKEDGAGNDNTHAQAETTAQEQGNSNAADDLPF
jgi:single-strand DNA-binding protein